MVTEFFIFQSDVETDQVTKPIEDDPVVEINPSESQPIKSDESKQDRIIKYSIEKEEKTSEINLNINLQNILQEIGVKLQEQKVEPLNQFGNLPGTPSEDKEIDNDFQDEEEDEIPLTPEMTHANTIYHQAMKLINGTTNRQYDV